MLAETASSWRERERDIVVMSEVLTVGVDAPECCGSE